MKKSKLAAEPRVPKNAMAAKEEKDDEKEDAEEMARQGGWDLDTLLAAEEIKKNPEKMKFVMKALDKKEQGFKSIAELKMAYDAKFGAGKKA